MCVYELNAVSIRNLANCLAAQMAVVAVIIGGFICLSEWMLVDELLTKRGLYINVGHLFDTSNQKPPHIRTVYK